MNRQWKVLFPPYSPNDNPGLELYTNGQVTDLVQNGDTVTAQVDHFPVKLLLEHGTPVEMHCACPRTQELCTHMAALLYAIEQPEESWEKELDDLVGYMLDHPCIEQVDSMELNEDIADALQHALLPLLRDGQLLHAMKLVGSVYETAIEHRLDPRCDGEFFSLSEHCVKTWQKIFDRAAPAQREDMRLWFWKYCQHWSWRKVSMLTKCLFDLPWHPTQQKKNLKQFEQMLTGRPDDDPMREVYQRVKASLNS